jgi:hypothetical protein
LASDALAGDALRCFESLFPAIRRAIFLIAAAFALAGLKYLPAIIAIASLYIFGGGGICIFDSAAKPICF